MGKQKKSSQLAARKPDSLVSLRSEIDKLFEDFASGWPGLGKGWMEPFHKAGSVWGDEYPSVDVVDKKKEMIIKADLPGMNEEDVHVELSNNMLSIHGEKKDEHVEGEEKGDYYVSERRFGSFRRSFALPEGVDPNAITAKFRKGVLTVKLPKTAEAQEKSRKVEIAAG